MYQNPIREYIEINGIHIGLWEWWVTIDTDKLKVFEFVGEIRTDQPGRYMISAFEFGGEIVTRGYIKELNLLEAELAKDKVDNQLQNV